ncbi:MAG: hypothetical protein H0V66_16130 [Bdellovibrionales bacterium]|nr:hypothetical protein [Bdellovibrionales bacterium]
MKFILFLLLIPLTSQAEINLETHDISVEYGVGYHTLKGEQKSNNSKGRLTSLQNPYWLAAYTLRTGAKFAIRIYGGTHLVRFDEPAFGTLKNEDQVLNQYGIEVINKTTPIAKTGFFFMLQEHPLYFAKTPTDFEVLKKSFYQAGVHFSLGQRRRIGLLWGVGIKGYTIFPTEGGNVTTESGVGTEAYARLGWVGPFGTLYQVKGMYQVTTAPNADIEFTHEFLGYCFQVSHSF